MINFRLYIALACFSMFLMPSNTALGQSSLSKDFGALNYDGGTLFMDVRLGSNWFGSGVGEGSFSGLHSTLTKMDGGTVFGNPASLAHFRSPQIGFESRLSMRNGSFGLGSTTNLPASFENKTDELLLNLSLPEGVEPNYTKASFVAVGQPRQLSAFWLNWPVTNTVGVGFGYRQPMYFSGNIALSGFQTLLSGNKASSNGSIQVDLLAELALRSASEIQVDEVSIGTGGLLEKYSFGSVWWGASLYRYGASANLALDVLPQGVLTISGTDQFYFNDASDPNLNPLLGESNAFYWQIKGGFKGNGFGTRLGMTHRTFNNQLGTSILLDIAPRIEMWDGDATARSFMPVFINLEGVLDGTEDSSKELLDIEQLDLVRPNLSRQTHDAIGQWMFIHLPTTLTIGLDVPFGKHNLVLNAARSWGTFAVEGEYGLKNGVLQRYKLGKKPSWGLKAGLDFGRTPRQNGQGSWNIPLRILTLDIDGVLMELMQGWTGYAEPRYRFSGGVQWGEPVVYGLDNTFSTELEALFGGMTLTSLSIGRAYSLFDRLHVGVHVIGVPDLMMRFSFALNMD